MWLLGKREYFTLGKILQSLDGLQRLLYNNDIVNWLKLYIVYQCKICRIFEGEYTMSYTNRKEIPEKYKWDLSHIFATPADWEARFVEMSTKY